MDLIRLVPAPDRTQLRNYLAWFLLWLVVTAIAVWLTPSSAGHGTHQQLGLPPCSTVLLWNRPCPGCGMTTSFTATVHGRWVEAWNAHPFGIIGYVVFTASALVCIYAWFAKKFIETSSRTYRNVVGGLIIGFVLFGLYRMATTKAYPYNLGIKIPGVSVERK